MVANFRDAGLYGARGYGALTPRTAISIFIEGVPGGAILSLPEDFGPRPWVTGEGHRGVTGRAREN